MKTKNMIILVLLAIAGLIPMAIKILEAKNSQEDKKEIIKEGKKDKNELLDSLKQQSILIQKAIEKSFEQEFHKKLKEDLGYTFEQLKEIAIERLRIGKNHFDLGNSNLFLSQYNEAINYYSQALATSNDDLKWMVYNNRAYARLLKLQKVKFENSDIINSQLSYNYDNHKLVKNNLKEVDLIFDDLKSSISTKKTTQALYNLASLNYKLDNYEKTIEFINQALEIEKNPDFYNNKSIAYGRLAEINQKNKREFDKFLNEALININKAISISISNPIFYANRSKIYLLKKNFELAKKDADQAISLYGDYGQAYFHLGIALWALGENEESFEAYSRSIELNPRNPKAYENRGKIFIHYYNDKENALKDFEEGLKLDDEDISLLLSRGMLYTREFGNHSDAVNDFSKALSIDDSNTWGYTYRGFAYFYKQDYDKAIRDFSTILEREDDNWEIYFYRSLCYKKLKRKEESINDFVAAKKYNPNLDEWVKKHFKN